MKKLIYLAVILVGFSLVSCNPETKGPDTNEDETALSKEEISEITTNFLSYTENTVENEVLSSETQYLDIASINHYSSQLYMDDILIQKGEAYVIPDLKEGTDVADEDKDKYIKQTTKDDINITRILFYETEGGINKTEEIPLSSLTSDQAYEYFDISIGVYCEKIFSLMASAEDSEKTDTSTGVTTKITYQSEIAGNKLDGEIALSFVFREDYSVSEVSDGVTSNQTTVDYLSGNIYIKDGFVTQYREEHVLQNLIDGGQVTYKETTSVMGFRNGDREAYDGTLLNPDDIK